MKGKSLLGRAALSQPCAQPCVTAPAAVKPPRISQGCTEGLRPTVGWGCPIGHGLPYASSLPYLRTSAPHRVLRPFLDTHGWIIFSLGGCCEEEGKRVGSRLGGRGRGDALRLVQGCGLLGRATLKAGSQQDRKKRDRKGRKCKATKPGTEHRADPRHCASLQRCSLCPTAPAPSVPSAPFARPLR